jgi:DNA-binding CsgD family transcriptional regulator
LNPLAEQNVQTNAFAFARLAGRLTTQPSIVVGNNVVQGKKGAKSDLLLKIVDEHDIEAALAVLKDIGQYQHVIYHLAFRTNSPTDMPFFKSTYPFSWLGQYIQRQYSDIDPVILDGFQRNEPFLWSDLTITSDAQREFFEDAYKHGAGRTGFSIPLTDKAQRRAMFSVTSNLGDDDWKNKIKAERKLLEQVGDVLHRKAVAQVYGTEDGPALSPREIECLYWTAKGKDSKTVSDILNISEFTVRDYLKSARHKLGCNNIAQAIHEATKRRLINL